MEPFGRYRKRLTSLNSDHVFDNEGAQTDRDLPPSYYFTAEQLLDLAWSVAGATMAALGVARDEMPALGDLVAPTIYGLVREHGITVPNDYRQ